MKIIDTYTHEEAGYNPFLITDRWQVALLNYAEAEALERIDRLDIHYRTDEVFVLLRGHAALIGAEIAGSHITWDVVDMQPGVVYNIRKEVWHKIAMQPGSQVLIVENNDTHLGDFEFYHLSEAQKAELKEAVRRAIRR